MEHGNDPFESMRAMDNVPLMGSFDFENIRIRCGDMLDKETGEQIGVVVEWWFVPLPWFRFRLKLERMHAIAFMEKFDDVLMQRNKGDETAS
jgi:hypothetical protein